MISDLSNYAVLLNFNAFIIMALGLLLVSCLKKFRASDRQLVLRKLTSVLFILPLLIPVMALIPSVLPSFNSEINSLRMSTEFLTAGEAGSGVFNWQIATASIYLFVALILMLKLIIGIVYGGARIKYFEPCVDPEVNNEFTNIKAQLNLRKDTRILINLQEETPFVWGWLRPAVVVPFSFFKNRKDLQQNILRHELIHVRNNDWVSALIGKFCCCIYWLNPMIWQATYQSQLEAEKVCDEDILLTGGDAENYAEQLVHIAKTLQEPKTYTSMAPSMARISTLRCRIDNILKNNRRRFMKANTLTVLKSSLLILSLLFVAVTSSQTTTEEQAVSQDQDNELLDYRRLHTEQAIYPSGAARQGIEGYTVVEYDISSAGEVVNPRIIDSVPEGVFDKVSLDAIKQWTFTPASLKGRAEETKGVRSRLAFKLRS